VVEEQDWATTHRRELTETRVRTPDVTRFRHYGVYDADGRVALLGEQSSDEPDAVFGVDPQEPPHWTQYAYDALDRLNRVDVRLGDGPLSLSEQFGYDALGNLLQRLDGSDAANNLQLWYGDPDPDRLCRAAGLNQSGPCTHQHDAVGNVTRIDGASPRQFTYDSASRAVRITRATLTADFAYGGSGELAEIKVREGNALKERTRFYGSLMKERYLPAASNLRQLEREIPGPTGVLAAIRTVGAQTKVFYYHGDKQADSRIRLVRTEAT
jgi:YD repeat-containing protein